MRINENECSSYKFKILDYIICLHQFICWDKVDRYTIIITIYIHKISESALQ